MPLHKDAIAALSGQDPVRAHWDKWDVESLDDKHWAAAERRLIRRYIPARPGVRLLDAGCGEGEGTAEYAQQGGVGEVLGIDYSPTRLSMAIRRCQGQPNVSFNEVDLRAAGPLPSAHFDCIICTRVLINLKDWNEQQAALDSLIRALAPGGRLVLLEGSVQGQAELNGIRAMFGLAPIECRWFNQFLDDAVLEAHIAAEHGLTLVNKTGLGAFFLLTRGIRQFFDTGPDLHWDTEYNRIAASEDMEKAMPLGKRYSRVRLWVYDKAPAV